MNANIARVEEVWWRDDVLFVKLDLSECDQKTCEPPALLTDTGSFVLMEKACEGGQNIFSIRLERVKDELTTPTERWVFVDSKTLFALRPSEEMLKDVFDLSKCFHEPNSTRIFGVFFSTEDHIGTERFLMCTGSYKDRDAFNRQFLSDWAPSFIIKAGILCLRGVYCLLKLLPSRKNKYLFISKLSTTPPPDFKILASAIKQEIPHSKIVILAKKMHPYRKYVPHMFRQMYHLATSSVVFLDRSCLIVHVLRHKKSLRVVQMWHAIGAMKKFGYANIDTPEGQPKDLAESLYMHRGYTDILISSFEFKRDFIEGFGIDETKSDEILREIPLPRCDFLTNDEEMQKKREGFKAKYPRLQDKINILYCPTYRKSMPLKSVAKKGYLDLALCLDPEKYNLIYSPHPLGRVKVAEEVIVNIPAPTFELLSVADVVVTDYSAILYEAGLAKLPVYIYAYDWDNYSHDRPLNIDFQKTVPAPFKTTAEQLVASIENEDFDAEAFGEFIERYVKLPKDKTCSQAIIDLVS